MFKNKPLTLLIASGLLTVLVVLTLVFQFAGGALIGRPGGNRGSFPPGQSQNGGAFPNGANPPADGQNGSNNFQPGTDTNGTGNFQRPNFNRNSTTMKLLQLLRGVEMGASILIALLGILSIVGILLAKAWGRKWAITTSVIALLVLLPSLFQMRFGSSIIITVVKFVLAAAVIVLCALPKSKQIITVQA